MRIAGLRIDARVARLLAGIVRDSGYADTAAKLEQAIELRVASEVPLTWADHEAILVSLGDTCPTSLTRLRRELLDEERRMRRPSS